MAKSSRMPDEIRARRETVSAQTQDPIRTFRRSAVQHHESLYANLPTLARQQLDISAGDDISVEVYSDRVVIHR